MGASSSDYSEWNIDEKVVFSRVEIWWNVGCKYGETRGWTTVHPTHRQVCHRWRYGLWHRHRIEPVAKVTVILGQGEWSIAKDIGPFFKRCNARHRQTFFNLVNVNVFNIWSICIHWKELLRQFAFHQKYRERSHNETDVWHIWKVDSRTIRWVFLECLGSTAKVYVFSDSELCLGKVNQNPTSNTVWERQLGWFQDSPQYRILDTFDGEPMELEWNIFPGFSTLQLINKVQEFMSKMGEPEQLQGRIIFNDIKRRSEDNERECIANATFVTLFSKRLPWGRSSFLGPGSEKKLYSTYIGRPQGEWDRVAELMMIKFRESGPSFPCHESIVPRNGQKQIMWKIINTLLCRLGYGWNCFRTIISVNQLSIYGAVSDVCEEYSTCQTRTGRPVLAGQSDPLFEPARLLRQHYTYDWSSCTRKFTAKVQRTSGKASTTKLSQQDRLIKICTDAGFLQTAEVGQYFMSKHTDEFFQSTDSVACREYTLSRDEEEHPNQKVGSEGTPTLDPCWKSQPVICKVNMELRSESSLWTKTILTLGSEFLMAWTSWSRIWTTTSRKPQNCSSKNVR